MAKFNKLDVPHQWKDEFTKYPHGYTIFEALCKWVKQVDNMVDNINNWNDYLNNFVESFEFELQEEVQSTVERWKSEGLLDDIIGNVLNTELDSVKSQLADLESDLNTEINNVMAQLAEIETNKFDNVNIRDFGAVGDGVTDDSQAIQDAIDFAVSLPQKKTVFMPDGNYLIKETIIFYNETVIRGAGERGTTIIVDVPNGDYGFKYSGRVSRVHLSHFRIKPYENKENLVNAIDCGDMRYSSLKHLVIHKFNVAISFDGECYVNYIQHNRLWDNLVNIDVNRTNNMLEANHFNVNYNEFYDSDYGIRGLGGRSQIITNNVFERVDTAIQQANTARPLIVRDNHFEAVPTMLRIQHSDLTKKFIIENNYISSYGGEGRYLIEIEKTTALDPTIKYISLNNNFFHANNGGTALIDREGNNVDRYTVDFYGNTFSTVNNTPILYYLDIFTETSEKPFSKANFFNVKTDLPLFDLRETFTPENWLINRRTVLLVRAVPSLSQYGTIRMTVAVDVNSTFVDRVYIPSDITPYETIIRTGHVIYTDNTIGLMRVSIRSDSQIRFEGIDSDKTVKTINFDVEYGNRGSGIF